MKYGSKKGTKKGTKKSGAKMGLGKFCSQCFWLKIFQAAAL